MSSTVPDLTDGPPQRGRGVGDPNRKVAGTKLTLLVMLFGLVTYLIDLSLAADISGIQIGGLGLVTFVFVATFAGLARYAWKEFLLLFGGTALALGGFLLSAAHAELWWLGVGGTFVAASGGVRLALFVIDSKSDDLIATCSRRFSTHR